MSTYVWHVVHKWRTYTEELESHGHRSALSGNSAYAHLGAEYEASFETEGDVGSADCTKTKSEPLCQARAGIRITKCTYGT